MFKWIYIHIFKRKQYRESKEIMKKLLNEEEERNYNVIFSKIFYNSAFYLINYKKSQKYKAQFSIKSHNEDDGSFLNFHIFFNYYVFSYVNYNYLIGGKKWPKRQEKMIK